MTGAYHFNEELQNRHRHFGGVSILSLYSSFQDLKSGGADGVNRIAVRIVSREGARADRHDGGNARHAGCGRRKVATRPATRFQRGHRNLLLSLNVRAQAKRCRFSARPAPSQFIGARLIRQDRAASVDIVNVTIHADTLHGASTKCRSEMTRTRRQQTTEEFFA